MSLARAMWRPPSPAPRGWRVTLEVNSLLLAPYTGSQWCLLLCFRGPCGDPPPPPGPGHVETPPPAPRWWRATPEVSSLLLAPYTDSRWCPLLCFRRLCGPTNKKMEGGQEKGQCPGSLVPCFVHLLAAEWY